MPDAENESVIASESPSGSPAAGTSAPGVHPLAPLGDSRRFRVQFVSGARTDCVIGPGALELLPALLQELDGGPSNGASSEPRSGAGRRASGGAIGFLCDAKLFHFQKPLIDRLAATLGPALARAVREDRKSLAEVEAMCETLAMRGLARDGLVFALGGGVLTDLAGLAAALYQRGVPWISAPTTLLAQVDAGLGGKTGANLRAGKNLAGAFHQPRLVICDTRVLATLPERERWSGLAEVVKCALLEPARDADGEGFLLRCERSLEQAARGDAEALAPLIAAAIGVKAEIVALDEREGEPPKMAASAQSHAQHGRPRLRAFLNLGHTVGHAIESATGYARFTHGEAVAIGLRGALALSKRSGLAEGDAERALALIDRLEVEPPRMLAPEEKSLALEALARDKKARAGQIRFVLLGKLGEARLQAVTPSDAAFALDAALTRRSAATG